MLLVVFVHGFKGDDETFGQFPQRLQHILGETPEHGLVHSVVFPAYETKGNLNEAVDRFAGWLTTLTVQKEAESGNGAGSANVVLCGHSMGGLLTADTLLQFANTRTNKQDPLWPKIIACIAFDTPFLGLHPNVVKNTINKAAEYAGTAQTIGSAVAGALAGLGAKKATAAPATAAPSSNSTATAWSGWGTAAFAVGGALLAGAAAGSAWYNQEHLTSGITWATDHMKFVGNLWDERALKERLRALLSVEDEGIAFRTFYIFIPPSPPFSESRTFIMLPKPSSLEYSYFIQNRNNKAPNEIQAHMNMFNPRINDGYYDLGLAAAKIIREAFLASNRRSGDDGSST